MQFVLVLQVCLLGLIGLSGASPGTKFLMMFPPHNDPTANVSHQVTITASEDWTSVTVKVMESSFMQHIFLSASQSMTVHLPSFVEMANARSSCLLSVKSIRPITVLASFCTQTGCEHSLLHDVSSWGTHYYPITPNFPNHTAVSQMVITSSDYAALVDIFISGDVVFEGNMYPKGSVLKLHLGALQSVHLQSNYSLSGSELNSNEAVSVVVGFTCYNHTPGNCMYGFAELKPVSHWSFEYFIPPWVNTGISSSFLLAMATVNSDLDVTTGTGRKNVPLVGTVMKVIPVRTSDKIHITSDNPLQLIYFRLDNGQHSSTLTALLSVDDICQTESMVDPGDMSEWQDNSTHTGDFNSSVKFSQEPNFAKLPDNAEPSSPHINVGHYLSTISRQLYPAVCEKNSCEELHCGHKRICFIKDAKPHCSLKTKICSAWGDSYYRTFDGRDFVLLGNCNYSLVQTTCPGLNASVPLQINIARAYLNSATVSVIHTVQISIKGFNISIIKEEKNHVRVDGQKRNLPFTMGNGSLNFYPSGSSVVLETSFGLVLQYDWNHHLQVEVGPELYGVLCGLCGNANYSSSNGTDETQTVDFTLPWVVSDDKGSCIEDCGGVSCSVCTQSQTKSIPGIKGNSLERGCTLLQSGYGPFADCHSYIDPEPFVRSCVNNLCVSGAASSMCKVLSAYANICQKFGAKVQKWRTIAKCSMTCPRNSHYEICGSACPGTCANPEAHHNCSLPCVESCQCNRGYLLSGGNCVAHSECGCVHNGYYYLDKENFWIDKQCQEKCVCQSFSKSFSKTVVCAQSHCQDGEVCKVLDGVLGCSMDGPGMCIAKGDPHYTTFDGRNFDVYGNCSYLLTSHCPSWGDMEDFSVEVQNQMKDGTNSSFRLVKIAVSGYHIEMSYNWSNRIRVNGLLLSLPLVLSQGKVNLYMAGFSTCIETDFGLVVTYSSDILTVQMPIIFSGNLCGLCGNFNANPEDDLMPEEDSDISQAARYWRTSSEHECVDVPMNTSGCNPQEMALYQGKYFCGMLLDTEGAFQSCHKTVDPQDFYDNCVHDLCYGNQITICQILSSYVAVCQEMGAIVDEWRASDFCNLSCPSNSEYNLCSTRMSNCVESPSPQAVKCKEGCFCKAGFFHSGGECVPNSECGCIYNGVYYEIHVNFYPDEHCQLHCVCMGHNQVQCRNHTCQSGTKCAIQDGHRACHASQPVKCTVTGGRHIRSYDGHSFDFNMGSCRYVLSQICDKEEPYVVIQQGQLDLRVHGMNMSLEMEHFGKVKIDGVLRRLPVQLDHITILHSGLLTRVVVDIGVVVTYGGPNLIQIEIPASHMKMCGLCGIVSAAPTDDKQSLNDSRTGHVSIFASSWSLSPPGTNCSEERDYSSVCNSTMTAYITSDGLCGQLLAPTGSFSGCHSTVDPEKSFQNCVNDMCMSNGSEELLCNRLREYTFACQVAGAEIKPWRGEKCSLSCPEYSHYNACVGACPESCAILSDVPCPWPCYEGCQCDSGYMQSGNGCVKAEQCGCFYHGYYYEIGEISWAEGCSVRCNCSAAGTMFCEPASCPEGRSCTLNNTWGCAQKAMSCPLNSHYESCGTACPATCEVPLSSSPCTLACVERCQCDTGFVLDGDSCVPFSKCGCTHNGYRYHSNQTFWADEGCTEQCVCDPHTHQTRCYLDSCGSDEYCDLHDGVRSCVQHSQQTCMYTGHHIVTFDQHSYELHGTCQYQLLGMCGQKQGLDAIQVLVQTDGHLQSEQHVVVSVSGVLVELNSKNTENIEVNGVKRNMPYYLSPTALAFSLGLHTYVYTDTGFVLSLSVEGIVSISLSVNFANATCGLCGNFNSDPADDLSINGTQERLSPEHFGKAWRSGQHPWCVEGCLGESCPKCSTEHLALYSDPEACGKILEVNGPFRHCHGKVDPSSFYKHCVSDLCLHGGLQSALCHSLAEYTAVCLSHKATVYTWRSPGFCYQSCPSSTSYNMSSSPVHLCFGWQNNTVLMPPNIGENCLCEAGLVHSGSLCVYPENCGCFHHGEYLRAGQKVSTCEQSCLCHAGGHKTCRNVSCGEDEECKLIRGVQGCHPKAKVARCSVDGSQYTTFDGQAFEFHGSCNYTLVQTCSVKKLDVEPVLIAAQGNYSEGRQIYLHVNKMSFKMSTDFPGKIQVNGVYENLPFFQNYFSVHQKNGWRTIKTPQSVEIISDLHNHIQVRIPDIYHQTTCGLCGNYNDNPSDDLQLPNGTVISDPDIFGLSWKLFDNESSCSNTCGSTCQLCQSPVPKYTSDLYCGLITQPRGSFSSCHHLVSPRKYYSLCMKNLCIAEGQGWALCDSLQAYEAACKEAGVNVDLWRNTTGCAHHCPQFSHYTQCTNVCSSLCPEISQAVQCPRVCEEGCQCDTEHLYDGDACVPAEQCGCIQDGRRFKASESKLLQNCTINCTCGPPLVCEQYSCPPLHSCLVSEGILGCHKDVQNLDPCEGKCDETEKCYLSNGVPVCESCRGLCWAWGGQHYHTFDGLNYDFKGNCTYLLAASKGAACGLTPFSVSKKNEASATQVVTVKAHGFIIKLISEKGTIHVNGRENDIPVNLLGGKIQVSYREGKALLKTDFGMQVVFDWNSTVLVTLNPHYKEKVYGLCGNFNGDPQDEYAVTTPGSPPIKTNVALAQAYRLFDGNHNCCTGCKQELDEMTFDADTVSNVASSHRRLCAVLMDLSCPYVHCHARVNPDSFYESCVSDLTHNGWSKLSLEQAIHSYSIVCEETSDDYHSEMTVDVHCPPNSHYKTCGSACPPSCEYNATFCIKICVQGCFCDPGFIGSPEGCVRPQQCGCTDSRGKYHSLNSTFWIPDDCGQLCVCGPATGLVHCSPSQCPTGMVCKKLHHEKVCQPENPHNCTVVTGLHFTTFDGHHFDFRDSCAYSLVQTNSNLTRLTTFSITISDAICHKKLFQSLTVKLSIYGLTVVLRKDDPGKVLVDGLYKHLPYSHQTSLINAYHTPSSLIIHTDVGLQLIVYKTGTLMVILPSRYGSSVSGLCGNANADPNDDLIMSTGEQAQNTLEFAHSWRSGGAVACSSSCTSRLKHCPAEAQKLYEGSDFCGTLLNELGPFADCASVLSPKPYFHSCVADSCSHGGHYSALCNSIASYAAACQAAQLPIRQWRSDTFCGISCPKNSHYELCGPRCPVVCAGLSSPAKCSGSCEEGCQCDPGYVLSDGQCVLVSDCGCMHEEQYHPAGFFYSGNNCQKCNCKRGVTCDPSPCRPMESCSVKDGHVQCWPLQYGVCQIFAGFGYITFDGLVLPHHGACTYLVSDLSSKAIHDYTLLLSFEKDRNDTIFTISSLVFLLHSLEVSIDPKTPWKIKVNGEEHSLPFDNGKLKAYQDGNRMMVTTLSGVKLELSSTQYLRLTVPQGYDTTASGLCGNFNGDKSDDLELRNGHLAKNITEFLHSWVAAAPGQHCMEICGIKCDQCSLPSEDIMTCDILMARSIEFSLCWNSGVEPNIYRDLCIRAVCAGAGDTEAACLAIEAYAASCQAQGMTVGSWRKNTPCSLQCPDRSSPSECVDSGSNSCPALLQPGSSAARCSDGCQCLNGNVFDGDECVPYSQCGCVLHDKYIKMDEQLYSEDCTQRCWCHPLGGVICEKVACSPWQQCALRNGSWDCHDRPDVCELKHSLQVSTLSGQQLNLEPQLSYSLMSLCDEASEHWFSLISYHGPCDGGTSRPVSVFQILLQGSSVAIQKGIVKVNGRFVSLPHILPSGASLSSGVTQDKSEVTVFLKRDAGMESELEMEIGVTMVTVRVPPWYLGKLCGLCGNLNDVHSHKSVKSWVLPDFRGCGVTG